MSLRLSDSSAALSEFDDRSYRAPGKVALTQRMARGTAPSAPSPVTASARAAVQRAALAHELAAAFGFAEHPLDRPDAAAAAAPVQRHGDAHTGLSDDAIATHAAAGVSGAGGVMPHLESIQRAFGPAHDLSGVRAHVGGAAADASSAIGAHAYATGNDIAFASSPDLFLAAHEATHIVQQRQGVHLKGAVGQAGDSYEQHADAVAAAVVRGEDVSELLGSGCADEVEAAGPTQRSVAVQRTGDSAGAGKAELLAKGEDAMRKISKVLPRASPLEITSGTFRGTVLRPGTVFGGDKCMVINPTFEQVVFSIDDRLYGQASDVFMHGQGSMGAFQTAGVNGMGMVHLIQAEFALLSGMFLPWWAGLGLGAAQIALEYEARKDELEPVVRKLPQTFEALNEIRKRYPTLFWLLATEVLKEVPAQVSAEDAMFLAGRVVANLGGLSGAMGLGGTIDITPVAFKTVSLLLLKCAAIVFAVHLPAYTAKAAEKVAKKKAEEFKASFAAVGLTISVTDAEAILQELLADPDSARLLKDVADQCAAIAPMLEKLGGH